MSVALSPLDHAPAPKKLPLLASVGAAAAHAAVVGIALLIGARFAGEAHEAVAVSQLVDLEIPPEVAPLPEKPPPLAELPAPPTRALPQPAPARPPAAAQAGQVLTAASDEVDFGDSIVVGKSAAYAGGTTETNGSAQQAARDQSARGAGPTPIVAAAPPLVDHTRAPRLAGGGTWDCPFPGEADDEGLDHAVVSLRVEVSADGRVLNATATRDPGHGFGREARRCALSKRWSPGLDQTGSATTSFTVVNVRFDR